MAEFIEDIKVIFELPKNNENLNRQLRIAEYVDKIEFIENDLLYSNEKSSHDNALYIIVHLLLDRPKVFLKSLITNKSHRIIKYFLIKFIDYFILLILIQK